MTKAWKEYRDTITRLYITESRTLEEVKDIMQREHSFKASTRSYRQQFDKWQLGKYNCKKRNVRRLSQQSGIQIEASPTLIGLGSPDDGGGPSPA
uniref:Clr5 domain-containing protein n=1 Tax=Colletotrichum fructicola (strain Nara gc5) TaxID=1213859 RepID=L2G9T1_COLFN